MSRLEWKWFTIRAEKNDRVIRPVFVAVIGCARAPCNFEHLPIAKKQCVADTSLIEMNVEIGGGDDIMLCKKHDHIFKMQLPTGQPVRVGMQDARRFKFGRVRVTQI